MLISAAFAQTSGGGFGGGMGAFLPLILIFVVFYFLLIRPQQKKAKISPRHGEQRPPRRFRRHRVAASLAK